MAQLIVRNLDDTLKEKLRLQARNHGRSMQEEMRAILGNALITRSLETSEGLGSIRKIFSSTGFTTQEKQVVDSAIEDLRSRPRKSISFD